MSKWQNCAPGVGGSAAFSALSRNAVWNPNGGNGAGWSRKLLGNPTKVMDFFLGKQECSEVAIVFGNSCSFEKYFLLYSALRISVLKKQKAHTFLIIGHLLQCHFLLDSWIRICETSLVVVFNSWLIGVFFAILDILLKDFGSEPLNFHHGGFQHLFRLGWNWTQS